MTAARAFDETWEERWTRRLLSGPTLIAVTPVYLLAMPAMVTAAAATDLVRRRSFTATRFALALGANLAMHVAGFAGVFGAWLAGGRWAGADPERERRLEQRLQVWWATTIWRALARLFDMHLVVRRSSSGFKNSGSGSTAGSTRSPPRRATHERHTPLRTAAERA